VIRGDYMDQKDQNTGVHEIFMDRCIQVANRAMLKGNPPVGALLVKDGEVVAEGIEAGKSRGDVTAHAEIEIFRNALIQGVKKFQGFTVYSTHEPCVMCSYVIRHYEVKSLIFGVEVDELGGYSSGYSLLNDENITKWKNVPSVVKGIRKHEIEELNKIYRSQKD